MHIWNWPMALGTTNFFQSGGTMCGGAYHPLNGYVPEGYTLEAAAELRASDPDRYVELAKESMATQVRSTHLRLFRYSARFRARSA